MCHATLSCFSHVRLFVTVWTVACQALLSMGFSRKEWSGLPCPPPGDLPPPGIEPTSLICRSIGRWVLYHWCQLGSPGEPTWVFCIAQRTLFNIMWQPGWEGSLGENGYTAESLCYPPKPIKTLLIDCTLI